MNPTAVDERRFWREMACGGRKRRENRRKAPKGGWIHASCVLDNSSSVSILFIHVEIGCLFIYNIIGIRRSDSCDPMAGVAGLLTNEK
jgi:hypothetical protein